MFTEIIYNDNARKRMYEGVLKLANAVKVTLGAKGRNVVIRQDYNKQPISTKDGVSVARPIRFEDPYEDMGALMVKEAAEKTYLLAGDGTTTSTLLAQVIIEKGMEALESKSNPIEIKKGMDKAVAEVVNHLLAQAKKVDAESLINIAITSANNDAEIGKLVAEIVTKVGRDGIVTIQDSKTPDTTTEAVEGIVVDKGWISHYFVTDKSKMTVEFENPYILIFERKISALKDIQKLLEEVSKTKKPLLIIAEDVDGEALYTLIANAQRSLPFAAIKLPGYANIAHQQQIVEDLAIMLGAKVISETKGDVLIDVKMEDLGKAKKITIDSNSTKIFGAGGKKNKIEQHIEQVKALIANSKDDFEKERLKRQRLSKLTNGAGIIWVGAQTDSERIEKKARVDDALRATRAALEEGIIPGGGIAYLKAREALHEVFLNSLTKDQQTGAEIIKLALYAPFQQIMINAGEDAQNRLADIDNELVTDYGFNVKNEEYENFFDTGIIDPTKVARVALENACSVAGVFICTEAAMAGYEVIK